MYVIQWSTLGNTVTAHTAGGEKYTFNVKSHTYRKITRGIRTLEIADKDLNVPVAFYTNLFLSRKGLPRIGWITSDLTHDISRTNYPELRIMCIDIECYSETHSMPKAENKGDRIVAIGVNDIVLTGSEEAMFERLTDIIREQNPDIIIGYNVIGFDFPYLRTRGFQASSMSRGLNAVYKDINWSSNTYGVVKGCTFDAPGRIFIDVYQYVKREMKLDSYKLEDVCKDLFGETKTDMTPERLFTCIESSEFNEISEYCKNLVRITIKLFDYLNVWENIRTCSNIMDVDPNDLYVRGQTHRVCCMLFRECYVRGFRLEYVNPGNRVTYEGAHVIDPIIGVHDNVTVADFSSLYPSIIIANNICYSTLNEGKFTSKRQGIVPNILCMLIKKRKEAKEAGQTVLQNALKISANSVYGAYGSTSGYLRLDSGARLVTAIGRKYLNEAIELLKQNNTTVIYGDTDSCMFTGVNNPIELINSITKHFPEPVHLCYESTYIRTIFLTKKRYAAITSTGKIVERGIASVRRDRCKYARDTYRNALEDILNNRDPIPRIRQAVNNIKNVPHELLKYRRTIKDKYVNDTYMMALAARKHGLEANSVFEYVRITNSSTRAGERLAPVNTELPIDYDHYIRVDIGRPIIELLTITNIPVPIELNVKQATLSDYFKTLNLS